MIASLITDGLIVLLVAIGAFYAGFRAATGHRSHPLTPWEREEAKRYSRDMRHIVSETMQTIWQRGVSPGRGFGRN
jgi:hypothetical protein